MCRYGPFRLSILVWHLLKQSIIFGGRDYDVLVKSFRKQNKVVLLEKQQTEPDAMFTIKHVAEILIKMTFICHLKVNWPTLFYVAFLNDIIPPGHLAIQIVLGNLFSLIDCHFYIGTKVPVNPTKISKLKENEQMDVHIMAT